jgi:hypothetical protein
MSSLLLFKKSFLLLKEELKIACDYNVSILKALCEAQIPLAKLENPSFKSFLEKYTNRTIKLESWF